MANKTAKGAVENMGSTNLMIVLILISLLVVGVTGLVAKTMVVTIIRDTKVIAAKTTANNTLKTDLEAAPQLVTSFESLGNVGATISSALPNTSDFPSLLVTMERLSLDAGVRLKSVDPAASTTGTIAGPSATASISGVTPPSPQTFPVTITFDGTYATLGKLLGNLELSARPMRVVGLQLSGNGSALTGSINVETYYQDKATLPFGKETIK